MHICFIVDEYSIPGRSHGGIGRKLRLISEGLVKRGHKITIAGLQKDPVNITQNGVQIREVKKSPLRGIRAVLKNRRNLLRLVKSISKENKIDVIDIPESSGSTFPFRTATPVVVRCSCSHAYFASELGYRPKYRTVLLEAIALHFAKKVVACSSYVARRTETIFRLKSNSIDTLYNPVDTDLFTPAPDHELEKGLIVYIGSIVEKKGVLQLAEAFTEVVSKNDKARLVYIGRDTLCKETGKSFIELIKERLSTEAQQKTFFPGHLDFEQVRDYLRKAEVFTLPSKVEGHSNAIIEAQAAGKAIIVGHHGSALEIVNDGVDGFIVDPNDPTTIADRLLKLLGDDNLRKEFGQKAREFAVSKFSINVLVDKNEVFFKTVVESQK